MVVVTGHIGLGQYIEIAHGQHIAGGAVGLPATDGYRREAGETTAQTAQGGLGAAHLADDWATDAASAVEGDRVAAQRCRLVQEFALEEMGVIAVVFVQIIEVVVVENYIKGLSQAINVPRHVS